MDMITLLKTSLSERKSSITPFSLRFLIGVIADEVTVLGFLLAGMGDSNFIKNFIIIKSDTNLNDLEKTFIALYNRTKMGILLVADDVFSVLPGIGERLTKMLPIVVNIPTKTIFNKKMLNKFEAARHKQEPHVTH